jgi:hypothetical protein
MTVGSESVLMSGKQCFAAAVAALLLFAAGIAIWKYFWR